MAIRVEIGRTDGFRYIGIQPPLSADQYEVVMDSLTRDDLNLGLRSRVPYSGDCYTEGSSMEGSDEHIVLVAEKIADILRGQGDIVSVDKEIKQIGWGRHLFGGRDIERV